LSFFVLEVTARAAADVLGIQHNTAALFYKKIRLVITHHLEQESSEIFEGCVELDGSYFGGKRKGKRGRGAAGSGRGRQGGCLWHPQALRKGLHGSG